MFAFMIHSMNPTLGNTLPKLPTTLYVIEVTTSMSTERFNERLIALLETNPDFVDGTGELLRDRVKNRAWDFDHDLINLLLDR